MEMDFEEKIEDFAKLLFKSRYLVCFTGAGISTESGLPDFRGPDGVWTRKDKGLPPPQTDKPWHLFEPNQGHYAIVELQNIGKLKFLISQNVDNLHLKSGIKPELIAELHGNITKLRCSRCGMVYDRLWGFTTCKCGGRLLSSTVDFGQPLPERDLMLAYEHSRKADLFVVVGSSLVVTPAADMPKEAIEHGAKLVIINQGPTPFDPYTHLRFFEKIGDVLPKAVRRLKILMGLE
jgi:NAD-dependent SIR2 family protein deacetylase